MPKKKRVVYHGIVNHCYQRSADGHILFYTVSDFLLYYTIYCVTAVKYRIRVLKLALMPDHVHQAVIELRGGHMSKFEQNCHSVFAREHNRLCHRKGPVFEHTYGSAFKYTDKAVRTILVYLDNNPVERKLVQRAERYRWNFLAYGASDHPFSEKIVLNQASMALRKALKQVKLLHDQGRFLPYRLLQNLFHSLRSDQERDQLVDYIIVTYSVIDHKAAIAYFGSYEAELTAAHATSGSEHDLKERFNGKSDAFYLSMASVLKREGKYCSDIHEIFALPVPARQDLFQLLREQTSAPGKQIEAFLQIPAVNAND